MIKIFIFFTIITFIVIFFYYNTNKTSFYIPDDIIKINKEDIKNYIYKSKNKHSYEDHNLEKPNYKYEYYNLSSNNKNCSTFSKKMHKSPKFSNNGNFSFEIYSNNPSPKGSVFPQFSVPYNIYSNKMIIGSLIDNEMPYIKKRYNKMTKNIINDLNFILGGFFLNPNINNNKGSNINNNRGYNINNDRGPIIEEINDDEIIIEELYNKDNQIPIIEID